MASKYIRCLLLHTTNAIDLQHDRLVGLSSTAVVHSVILAAVAIGLGVQHRLVR